MPRGGPAGLDISGVVQRSGSPVRAAFTKARSQQSHGPGDELPLLTDLDRAGKSKGPGHPTEPGPAPAANRWDGASRRARTTALVYAAAVLERADETILPAVYLFVGKSLGVSPSQLGYITFARALTQALMSPVSGILGDRFNRAHVIAAGCCIWGVMTGCLGLANSMPVAMFFSAWNGVGLSLVIPCCQSLVADYYTSANRGRAFGVLQMLGNLGGLAGSMMATNLGGKRILGMEGWRFFYQVVALISLLCGAVVACFAHDPRFPAPGGQSKALEGRQGGGAGRSVWPETLMILRLRSFIIIIAQGIVGTMPWFCIGYFTLLFQLRGFSDLDTSLLIGIFSLATALGGFLGGYLGDMAARRSPNHGRIFVAQTSVLLSIPWSYVVLEVIPRQAPGSFPMYAAAMFVFGASASWCSASCNSPVFAEIVPEHLRSMIYAYDRCLEGGIAAMITPVVGIVAEQAFGFRTPGKGEAVSLENGAANAEALGQALKVTMMTPWVLCFAFYAFLHLTYAHDRDLAASGAYKRISPKALRSPMPDEEAISAEP